MNDIKFEKHEKLKFVLRILLVVIVAIIILIFHTAFDYSMSATDMNVSGQTFFTDDLTMMLKFEESNTKGSYYKYEFAEDSEDHEVVGSSVYAFYYELDLDNYFIKVDFLNPTIDDMELYFIKDGLLDINHNNYFYKY